MSSHGAKNAAVIGHPIAHSKSPLIHNYWLARYAIDAQYSAVHILPKNFETDVSRLLNDGECAGFNVTQPYKEKIIEFCDELDETAQEIGAVNTVYKSNSGGIIGANTDSYGFWQNILYTQPDFSVKGEAVCVLGAGGAARAVICALRGQNPNQLKIINRSFDKAEKLAAEFGGIAIPWEECAASLVNCKLLVNATSLGMRDKPQLDLDLSLLPVDALVNDIVYVPLQTELLQKAAQRGNKTIQGIGMLLYQAQRAFHYWYDILPEIDEPLIKKVLAL
jgi:shikimate dehydrogenase